MALFECSSCRRHVRGHETSCPFCGIVRATVVVAAAVMVAGCSPTPAPAMTLYGGPPIDPSPRVTAPSADGVDASTTDAATTPTGPTAATSTPPVPAYGGPPPPQNIMPAYGMPPSSNSPRK